MATVIQIKRSSAATAPSTLKLGELAYTYGTGTQANSGDRLFIGEGGVDGNGDANNISVIGGQYFTDMLDHAAGTLTANSAIIVDSNSAIDSLIVGNDAAAGGTVKLNEGTNNGTNFVGLKAGNNLAASTTFTLPTADGSAGQFIKTDGSGNLTFTDVSGGTSWQAVKTTTFTAVAGEGYFVDTSSGSYTATLPSSPTLGDEVTFVDYAGTFDTNNLTVGRNSENIQGSAADLTVSVERAGLTLVYSGATQGWLLKDK